MKLALATFSTALVLATGASAMVGPYERATEDPAAAAELFTTGDHVTTQARSYSSSPEGEWSDGTARAVTVFQADIKPGAQFGAAAR